jgi:hypothetical protein
MLEKQKGKHPVLCKTILSDSVMELDFYPDISSAVYCDENNNIQ